MGIVKKYLPSLKLTAKAPENRCLEYDCFLLGPTLFSGAKMLVSRVPVSPKNETLRVEPCGRPYH